MPEVKPGKPPKPKGDKVYSKNYFIKDVGCIGGLAVTKEIDAALDAALSNASTKASDFHKDK